MRVVTIIVSLFIVVGNAQLPKFEYQGKLKCNGQEVTDIGWPTSCVYDWDSDGLNDLLIGEFRPNKKVRFYKNEGTKANPEFKSFSYLKAAGADIVLSGG